LASFTHAFSVETDGPASDIFSALCSPTAFGVKRFNFKSIIEQEREIKAIEMRFSQLSVIHEIRKQTSSNEQINKATGMLGNAVWKKR